MVATPSGRCENASVTLPVVPARSPSSQGVNTAIAAGVVIFFAAVCWMPHLPSSLWLDETLTYWVVKDGLAEAIDRGVHYQPQPAKYWNPHSRDSSM